MQTVASIIVQMLRDAGVDRVFGVSGESYLGLLDALEKSNSIDVVTCRHEGGAGMMAVWSLTGSGGGTSSKVRTLARFPLRPALASKP